MNVFADVVGQKIKLSCNQTRFVSNTKGFIRFVFSFSNDWDNLVKIAQFLQNGICYEACLDVNDSVSLPLELNEGDFYLSLYAEGEKLLARTLSIPLKLEKCVMSDDHKIKATHKILATKISSTVSTPVVNYSVSYLSEKAEGKGVTVTLNFTSWIDDGATLGLGVNLIAFARLNDGNWESVVVKDKRECWGNTSTHLASLALSSSVYSSISNLEFYISRTGSTSSGLAGSIGDSCNPIKYSISV